MSYYRKGPFRPGGSIGGLGVPSLTPFVRALIIGTSAVWFVQLILLRAGLVDLSRFLGVVPAAVIRGAVWQPLTYMFLHSPGDAFHLLFNMLLLWMFGGELERHWGSHAFLRYYLVCGAGGGLFATAMGFLPGGLPGVPTIGASGAIFGLFIAYGMIFSERTILFMLIFPMKARTMAMIMFGITLLYTLTQPAAGVSHIAHLGGAVVGYLYLKRIWRIGELYREMKWKFQRRRFKVMPSNDRDDFDRWIH